MFYRHRFGVEGVSALDHNYGVGPVGHRGAGHYAYRFTRSDRLGGHMTRRHLVNHPQRHRRGKRSALGVDRAHRVAVHGGVSERGNWFGGKNIFGQHQTEGVGQRDFRRGQVRHCGQYLGLHLFEWN